MTEKIFKCEMCNYITNKSYNLKRHANKVHSEFFKQCICGKKYTTKSGYKRHIKKCYEILKNNLLKMQEKDSIQNITNNNNTTNNTTNISINLLLRKEVSLELQMLITMPIQRKLWKRK